MLEGKQQGFLSPFPMARFDTRPESLLSTTGVLSTPSSPVTGF